MKLLNRSLVLALIVVAPAPASAAIVLAYDDAADPTYNSGWAAGSNGGFGFGPWTHSIFGLLHAMGDSNLNGSLGGPGINVGGRAWEAAHQPNASGAVAGQSIFASRMQVTRPVPEPSSIGLLALAMCALVCKRACRLAY
jgi:hypothetical protein